MILRKMAIKSQGLDAFDYSTFKDELSATKFTSGQDGPMKLRLNLLESFMKCSDYTSRILANTKNDLLAGTPGSLTIVDLTDPVVDADLPAYSLTYAFSSSFSRHSVEKSSR
jgi:hypothetical protein